MPSGHSHRAGSLRQSNKRNKRSSASKRSLNRRAGGKVASRPGGGKGGGGGGGGAGGAASKSKADRLHMARQRRDAKRRKAVDARRNLGRAGPADGGAGGGPGAGPVPRLVGIVSLSEEEDRMEETVRNFILGGADASAALDGAADDAGSLAAAVTAKFGVHKREGLLTLLTNSASFRGQYLQGKDKGGAAADAAQDASILAALDLCRVCDVVVFAVDGSSVDGSAASPGASSADGPSPAGMSVGDGSSHAGTAASGTKFDFEDLISERGDRILAAVKAQGLPTPLTLLVNSEGGGGDDGEDAMSLASHSVKTARRHALRRRTELRRFVNRLAATEFGEGARVAEIDVPADLEDGPGTAMEVEGPAADGAATAARPRSRKILPAAAPSASQNPSHAALVRTLCTSSASPPRWVADVPRPYLLADGGAEYDSSTRELRLSGYVRGSTPWNVNSLVHIPNAGTFAVKCIESAAARAPFSRGGRSKRGGAAAGGSGTNGGGDDGGGDDAPGVESDPMKRESLDMFAAPDALDGEQNLIGFDEEHGDCYDDGDGERPADGAFQKGEARPAGWSDYQSAWLDAVDDDEEDGDDRDHGELAFALNQKKASSGGASVVTGVADLDMEDANDVTAEERRALLDQRRKDQQEDLEFPDEVEVREDEKASERFARYRSLKSFRKSYWDPKENLPETYGPLYHFSSFRATQRDVIADARDVSEAANECGGRWWGKTSTDSDAMDEGDDEDMELLEGCVPSGAYVTATIEAVPASSYARISPSALLSAVALLPHENKASVLHMGVSQTTKCEQPSDVPVKSKDVLTFRCGWRTWQARPVFSQNNLNSEKHKFERYLPMGGAFFAATVLGPVTYTPCPVLVFREPTGAVGRERRQLVAVGSVLGADADRIVVKRIVLTGYPVRVHKRHATVKYMFYNPDDVKWFKPAGLTTKHGLQGNIEESVGEHGTMKCLFNAPIKQHDTVCLPLYKRIYPKYATIDVPTEDGKTVRKDLVVL